MTFVPLIFVLDRESKLWVLGRLNLCVYFKVFVSLSLNLGFKSDSLLIVTELEVSLEKVDIANDGAVD